MKKKLEAELISLAHRILQLKNKQDIAVLQQEARKLYEKLSVLRFVEENFATAQPTIGQKEAEEMVGKAFDYDEKLVVGELPSEQTDDVPAAGQISAMVENLAASKTVSDDFGDQPEETREEEMIPAETASEFDAGETVEETETESRQDEDQEEEPAAETDAVTASQQPADAPTFEEGVALDQPEASEEVRLAEEAQKANALFWDAEPTSKPETPAEEPKTDDLFAPKFELSFDAKDDEVKQETKSADFTFDDLLGKDYADPVFVKPDELHQPFDAPKPSETQTSDEPKKEVVIPITRSFDSSTVIPINKEGKPVSLNERLSKGITIGLNDRIAFMKNLFNNSSEDYNRVLSQLITFDNYDDAKNFIEGIVKPDYNNWEGKDEYEQRFMEIVEKRFS